MVVNNFNPFLGIILQVRVLSTIVLAQTPLNKRRCQEKEPSSLKGGQCFDLHYAYPKHLWDEAVLTVVYLTSRMPALVLSFHTPLSTLLKNIPTFVSYHHYLLKHLGALLSCTIHNPNKSKLDPRAIKCVFIGYSPTRKGYNATLRSWKKPVSMDVKLFESQPLFPTSL